ncbi:MAG: hypothetical protein KGL26_01980 [Pseudomonadota bacterium]|nr:hypothetical protein [Pseudomonadota bacterium]
MTLRTFAMGSAIVCALALSGCGTNPGDRAITGSMLGAAGGAAIGAATGNPAAGAAIGAVAGAIGGAVTDPCDLDLGTPFWKHHGGRHGYEHRCGRHHRDD